MHLEAVLDGSNFQMNGETIDNVTVDAHPVDQAIIIKYRSSDNRSRSSSECQKVYSIFGDHGVNKSIADCNISPTQQAFDCFVYSKPVELDTTVPP
ncbi:unnamed protein product [Nippostrongylus brasiliensis]|uniref:Pectate lyase n=1 Tax=Nippostrongylus brasiliensis TaxID=27835 RepID=A0A0N4XLS9_NIPBR|nr:unnamed protein product [Nippostrongylus brasiliensis]